MSFPVTCLLKTKLEPDSSVPHTTGEHYSEMLDQERGGLYPAFRSPPAVPLINNTSWKLSCVKRTITAPNLVQNQRWGCDSTSSVLAFPLLSASEQLDYGEHVQTLIKNNSNKMEQRFQK